MATQATFLGPGGQRPSDYILKLAHAAAPTVGEALYAGQALRTRIRQRTAAQQDYMGRTFERLSDDYAKRKVRNLGHADADLFGYQAHPHMLNAIVVESGRATAMSGSEISSMFGIELDLGADAANGDNTPAAIVSLVIPDGPEAARAWVHNNGATIKSRLGTGKGKPKKNGRAVFRMPLRRFFDASPDDIEFMAFTIAQRRDARLAAAAGR